MSTKTLLETRTGDNLPRYSLGNCPPPPVQRPCVVRWSQRSKAYDWRNIHTLDSALRNPFRPAAGDTIQARTAHYRKMLWNKLKVRDTKTLEALRLITARTRLTYRSNAELDTALVVARAWAYAKAQGIL